MFQKKALAMAIATALPLAASAATITTQDDQFTNEALLTEDFLLDGGVTWAAGAGTAAGNEVVFTFSHSPVRSTGGTFAFPTQIECAAEGVLDLVSQTGSVITYEVGTAVAAEEACVIADGIDFATSGVAADADVTVTSVSTNAAGVSLGDDGEAALVFENLGDEFSAALTNLGATIDVEATVPQQEFVTATGDAETTATFTLTVNVDAEAAAEGVQGAALGNFEITLSNGDFAWLDTDGDTAEGIVTAGITIAAGAEDTAITPGEIDVTDIDSGTVVIPFSFNAAPANGDTVIVSLEGPGDVTIPEQDISVSITAAADGDDDITLLTVTGTDSFASNGSTVSVYAVPSSDSVENFIWVSNTSTSSGEVSVTIVDEGDTYGPYSLGDIQAGSVFDVGARFKQAAAAAGEELSGKRVRLDIITELPERNVAVSAAYKAIAADDRITLLTSNESEHDNVE